MLVEQCQQEYLERPAHGFWQNFGRLLQRFGQWIERSAQQERQRRQLLNMDEHMLKDIGLSRADVERIASRHGFRDASLPGRGKADQRYRSSDKY